MVTGRKCDIYVRVEVMRNGIKKPYISKDED
jgi:hypothetical protein